MSSHDPDPRARRRQKRDERLEIFQPLEKSRTHVYFMSRQVSPNHQRANSILYCRLEDWLEKECLICDSSIDFGEQVRGLGLQVHCHLIIVWCVLAFELVALCQVFSWNWLSCSGD